jgi:hypothetical protein
MPEYPLLWDSLFGRSGLHDFVMTVNLIETIAFAVFTGWFFGKRRQ